MDRHEWPIILRIIARIMIIIVRIQNIVHRVMAAVCFGRGLVVANLVDNGIAIAQLRSELRIVAVRRNYVNSFL